MGRIKKEVSKRHVRRSVSLPPYQVKFIEEHSNFDFSKFVQIRLTEYINFVYQIIKDEKETN